MPGAPLRSTAVDAGRSGADSDDERSAAKGLSHRIDQAQVACRRLSDAGQGHSLRKTARETARTPSQTLLLRIAPRCAPVWLPKEHSIRCDAAPGLYRG